MNVPLLRFRCDRCQKTLGVPAARVGAVVTCPACKGRVVVPSPDEAPTQLDAAPAPLDGPSYEPEPPTEAEPMPVAVAGPLSGPLELPIQLDAPLIRPDPPTPRPAPPPPAATPRRGDLVIPRVVVVSWSLFVLGALWLAFVAGLLAGRYVWKPRPIAMPAAAHAGQNG